MSVIETGFKLGLGIAAAGVALWVGGWVLLFVLMALFENHGSGK